MELRQKFNEQTKNFGNKVYEGLGNVLTKNVNLDEIFGVTGAISVPLTYAHFLTRSMYDSGIVDKMYSNNISERLIGHIGALPYEINWFLMLFPLVVLGSGVGAKIGGTLDKI